MEPLHCRRWGEAFELSEQIHLTFQVGEGGREPGFILVSGPISAQETFLVIPDSEDDDSTAGQTGNTQTMSGFDDSQHDSQMDIPAPASITRVKSPPRSNVSSVSMPSMVGSSNSSDVDQNANASEVVKS